jgi:DNA-binding CsgD family transcriptional regulator
MNSLTSREREIVLVLASGPGFSNKDVARRLNLSEGTVKVHLHNIYDKLRVKNRTALVVLAHTEFASVRTLPHTVGSDFERAELGICLAHGCEPPAQMGRAMKNIIDRGGRGTNT